MSDRWIGVSLQGLGLTKDKALDLVNRMNEQWPEKYVLRWPEAPYSNNAINPFIPTYHGQSAALNPTPRATS